MEDLVRFTNRKDYPEASDTECKDYDVTAQKDTTVTKNMYAKLPLGDGLGVRGITHHLRRPRRHSAPIAVLTWHWRPRQRVGNGATHHSQKITSHTR